MNSGMEVAMPRLINGCNEALDFCNDHFPSTKQAFLKYGAGDRPDCYAYDQEHPNYGTGHYTCRICRAQLTADDNHALGDSCGFQRGQTLLVVQRGGPDIHR